MGIELRVVRQARPGEKSFVPWPDCPPLVRLRTHRFGGLVDPRLRRVAARFGGEGTSYFEQGGSPVVWYCSEAQEPLLLHRDQPPKILCYGAMGAGKTRLLAMWLVLRSVELCEQGLCRHRPRAIGATAPTQSRLNLIVSALGEVCRPQWGEHKKRDNDIPLACGVTLELRATKQQSGAIGSPIQGQNWSAHAGDEYQDQTYAHAHIVARGRSAPGGVYRQLCTATAKDSMQWREFRDALPSEYWGIRHLDGPSNPFVHREHWDHAKANMSEREYRMFVLAEDVGPERAMFPSWDRHENVRPIPVVGVQDVTPLVLRGSGGQRLLIGHDPGVLRNVSIMLKAIRPVAGVEQPDWYVVDEFATQQTTTEEHAQALVEYLRTRHSLGPHQCLVRSDPWSQRDTHTHRSVKVQLKEFGFIAQDANYVNVQKRNGVEAKSKRLPLLASTEMLNRLFRSASGKRRLFLAEGEDGKPVADQLARALSVAEWDSYGFQENVRKGDKRKDPSDWHTALKYALWPYERTRPKPPARAVGRM